MTSPKVVEVAPPSDLPTEIHDQPCHGCPSAHHPPDPEVQDILTWPRERQLKTVFACGWRGDKLCRGYCDLLKINPAQ